MRAFLVLLIVAAANAANLLKSLESVPGQYIVKVKSDVDLTSVLSTVRIAGGNIRHTYTAGFRGFSASLPDEVLDIVLNLPAVEYVEENSLVRTQSVDWSLDRIDQRALPLDGIYSPQITNGGEGFHIFVIDSGINPNHDEFTGRQHSDNPLNRDPAYDCHGHGTHVGALVMGTNYGVATLSHIVAVKASDGCEEHGLVDDIIEALEWVELEAVHEQPAIAEVSFSGAYSTSLNAAVDSLVDSGVQTVVPAGNNNDNACNYSPASSEKALTVGSTDSSDALASYSNYGPCVDIFAPGTDITSAWIGDLNTEAYTRSGTCMSSALVAGALSVYGGLQDSSTFNGLVARAALLNSATSGAITGLPASPASNNLLLYV